MHACFFNNLNEILLTVEKKIQQIISNSRAECSADPRTIFKYYCRQRFTQFSPEILHHNPEQENNNQNTAMQSRPKSFPLQHRRFCSKQPVETTDRKLKLTKTGAAAGLSTAQNRGKKRQSLLSEPLLRMTNAVKLKILD